MTPACTTPARQPGRPRATGGVVNVDYPGPQAKKVYRVLLSGGGWWTRVEIAQERGLWNKGMGRGIKYLLDNGHIVRRGSGVRGQPHEYGVTAACKPMDGIALD